MKLENVKVTIDGREVIVDELRIEHTLEGTYPNYFISGNLMENNPVTFSTKTFEPFTFKELKKTVDSFRNEYLCDWKEGEMSLQEVPENLKKFLNENYTAFYQLNWVDKDMNLTSCGRDALIQFLLNKNEKEFGKLAQVKVEEVKAQFKGCEDC